MPESPSFPTPPDSRRPRFRSRGSQPESTTADESSAHQPPDSAMVLSLPEPDTSAPPELEETPAAQVLTLGPRLSNPTSEVQEEEERPAPRRTEEEKPLLEELQIHQWARPSRPPVQPVSSWWFILGGIALAIAGFVAGFGSHDLLAPARLAADAPAPDAVLPRTGHITGSGERLTPESQAALDGAFAMMRGDEPQNARAEFATLLKKHPGWPQLAVEQARAAFYQNDDIGAKSVLDNAEKAGLIGPADAAFMGGMLRMRASDFGPATAAFEQAASWDPTRDDVYYFWGECLRRVGKPAEAATRFGAAILRNQREAMAGFYQLKLWLAEIQGNLETASGTGARIDAELASPHPSGYALAAAAARSLRTENPAVAAGLLQRASQVLDPPVFRVVLHDSLFVQEAYRPEFAPLYATPAEH